MPNVIYILGCLLCLSIHLTIISSIYERELLLLTLWTGTVITICLIVCLIFYYKDKNG